MKHLHALIKAPIIPEEIRKAFIVLLVENSSLYFRYYKDTMHYSTPGSLQRMLLNPPDAYVTSSAHYYATRYDNHLEKFKPYTLEEFSGRYFYQ